MRSDQPAIIFAGDTLSYHQWWLWANRIAVHLHAQGVQPGDRVAVCATN
ncbi:MAG: AMP-binding protein, partial [Sphingopyxis sp.]